MPAEPSSSPARKPCEATLATGKACAYRAKGVTGDGRHLCGLHLRHSADVVEECPVCLGGMVSRSTACTLACGHSFHSACVRAWFRDRPLTCPMCRRTSLDGIALLGGKRLTPKLRALVRTVPPAPRSFFPAYIIGHLESPVVREALGCDKGVVDLLVDVACECFTKDNFFKKIRGMQL